VRFQMNFVVLFEICLGQTRGSNHNRFARRRALLRTGTRSTEANATEE
jgi:hypothetical protein